MDTKVKYVIGRSPCTVHDAPVGVACWSAPARTDGHPPVVGVCMRRAAIAGILTVQAKRAWLGIIKKETS